MVATYGLTPPATFATSVELRAYPLRWGISPPPSKMTLPEPLKDVAGTGLEAAWSADSELLKEPPSWLSAKPIRQGIEWVGLNGEAAHDCLEAAGRIGEALGYVGIFAVEFFLVEGRSGEQVVVNEIAPRVHNSGHWTSEGAQTSQFHQHVRAVCGFPLGATARRGRVTMQNLIGDQANDWRAILAEPGAHLHLYGKREARPGRKMGHVTRVLPEAG